MSIERRFLGWHRPALHLAAEVLLHEFQREGRWDMSQVAVALPGSRAGRRLRELLATRAASLSEAGRHTILIPPRILTVGELPELFYTTQIAVATDLEALLAWAEALRRMSAKALCQVFPGAARDPDPAVLYSLAGEAASIDQELAAECISCGDLEAYCSQPGHGASGARWEAFGQAKRLFRDVLVDNGRVSRNQARIDALQGSLRSERTIFIVAGADLPAITRRMLDTAQARIIALIHAPEDEAAGFDKCGSLDTSNWEGAAIPLPASGLEIVDFPRDQAWAVAQTLRGIPGLSAELATVGVCKESLGPPIERALEVAGKRARRAAGLRLSSSAPAQLLSLLSAYLSDQRAEHLAALVRHPDLNDWLVRYLDWPDPAGPWPDLCDQYIAERLPVAIDHQTKNVPAELARAVHAIWDLAGKEESSRQPLAVCIERIGSILAQTYAAGSEEAAAPDPARAMLTDALFDLSNSAQNGELRLTLTEAVGFLLSTCGSVAVPAISGGPQIDLIGWLEAHLDDAPVLVLAGFNEGAVPQSVLGDPFLPDSLRRDLGLPDNARRYARDAYFMRAILASRQVVRVVCGRLGAQNEPLAPSRLLLACSPEEAIRRILAFYGQEAREEADAQSLAPAADYPLASIPRPKRTARPLSSLRVTAFREYIACPYRFYLKYVLGLGTVDDSYVEMRPDAFGDLLHKVLQDFGRWVIKEMAGRPPVDPHVISGFLRDSLERRARARFGEPMHPAVAIQMELLGRRLEAFARFQAGESDAGWTILATERRLNAELDVDGVPFGITGRIDRIDYHAAHGLYRILDYKSRDGGCDPETSHRNSEGWTDLQLPLYRRLATLIDIGREIDEDSVEVGFIALPKDLKRIGYAAAPWNEEELYEASMTADEIIRKVRAQEFWPPNLNPPVFDDGFADICLDATLDRQAIIELDAGAEAVWPDSASAAETVYVD